MRVGDIMVGTVETASPRLTAKAAALRMARRGIGYLPVTRRGHLVGVVTDRDIACRLVAAARDPATTPIAAIMSKSVAYCFADDAIEAAVHLMAENRVRRLPVLDRSEHLVGIISASDIATHAAHHLTGDILAAVMRDEPHSTTVNPLANILR